MERLAREAGFRVRGLGPRFRDPGELGGIVQADGAHWNAAGHAGAGQILGEALAPLLASKRWARRVSTYAGPEIGAWEDRPW